MRIKAQHFTNQNRQKEKYWLPNGKPRLLIKALLHITMDTDDATERNSAPITPNWKPVISPILMICIAI